MTPTIAQLQEQLSVALDRKAAAVDRVREVMCRLHAALRAAGMVTPTPTFAIMRALKDLNEVSVVDVQPYCEASRGTISQALAALVRRGKLVRVRRGVYARAGRKAA